jgi:tripartite-type tricarboxylate transporter receptor subunit TctC
MMPDLPTIAESGVPGYEMAPWMGMWGPAKLPRAITEQVNAAMAKAQARPDVRESFIQQGLEVAPMSVDEFTALIPREVERYARLVKLTSARIE